MAYTKADFISDVAERAGCSKSEAEGVARAVFDTVLTRTKEGNKVTWPGFGAFSTSERAARKGRNPQTGEAIDIPASTVMKFSAAKALKEALNS